MAMAHSNICAATSMRSWGVIRRYNCTRRRSFRIVPDGHRRLRWPRAFPHLTPGKSGRRTPGRGDCSMGRRGCQVCVFQRERAALLVERGALNVAGQEGDTAEAGIYPLGVYEAGGRPAANIHSPATRPAQADRQREGDFRRPRRITFPAGGPDWRQSMSSRTPAGFLPGALPPAPPLGGMAYPPDPPQHCPWESRSGGCVRPPGRAGRWPGCRPEAPGFRMIRRGRPKNAERATPFRPPLLARIGSPS